MRISTSIAKFDVSQPRILFSRLVTPELGLDSHTRWKYWGININPNAILRMLLFNRIFMRNVIFTAIQKERFYIKSIMSTQNSALIFIGVRSLSPLEKSSTPTRMEAQFYRFIPCNVPKLWTFTHERTIWRRQTWLDNTYVYPITYIYVSLHSIPLYSSFSVLLSFRFIWLLLVLLLQLLLFIGLQHKLSIMHTIQHRKQFFLTRFAPDIASRSQVDHKGSPFTLALAVRANQPPVHRSIPLISHIHTLHNQSNAIPIKSKLRTEQCTMYVNGDIFFCSWPRFYKIYISWNTDFDEDFQNCFRNK